ncbi:hypothetical protein MTO96_026294 [Rhipicephalus appendiculatus]
MWTMCCFSLLTAVLCVLVTECDSETEAEKAERYYTASRWALYPEARVSYYIHDVEEGSWPGIRALGDACSFCHAMHSTFPHIGLRDQRTLRASVKDESFDFKTEQSHLTSDGRTSHRRILELRSPSTLALLCTSELPIKRAAG